MSKINQLIKNNCRRTGIDYGQGEEAWMMMWKFIKQTITTAEVGKDESFKSVFIKYFGTIYPHQPGLYKANQKKKLKDEKENRDTTIQSSSKDVGEE